MTDIHSSSMTGGNRISLLGSSKSSLGEVCQLFETVFGHRIAPNEWSWKYSPPIGSSSINLVSRDSIGITGHVGATILPGSQCGHPIRMAQITDMMVHSRARGGSRREGTFCQLMAAMQKGLRDYSFSLGEPLIAYGFPGTTPSHLATRLGLGRPLYACDEQLWQGRTRIRCLDHRWILEPWPLNNAMMLDRSRLTYEIDKIWEHHHRDLARGTAAPVLIKNAAYISWRYASGTVHSYTMWILRNLAGLSLGWLVTSYEPHPLLIDACIPVDWWHPPRFALLKRLLIRASGIQDWRCWSRRELSFRRSKDTGIKAFLLFTGDCQANWTAPLFQPGDTDVY